MQSKHNSKLNNANSLYPSRQSTQSNFVVRACSFYVCIYFITKMKLVNKII